MALKHNHFSFLMSLFLCLQLIWAQLMVAVLICVRVVFWWLDKRMSWAFHTLECVCVSSRVQESNYNMQGGMLRSRTGYLLVY